MPTSRMGREAAASPRSARWHFPSPSKEETMRTETEIVIEAWNTVLFEKFCRFRPLLTRGLQRHGEELLRRRPPRYATRVLDVGCGFGDTTRHIAALIGRGGTAVGVDCAA